MNVFLWGLQVEDFPDRDLEDGVRFLVSLLLMLLLMLLLTPLLLLLLLLLLSSFSSNNLKVLEARSCSFSLVFWWWLRLVLRLRNKPPLVHVLVVSDEAKLRFDENFLMAPRRDIRERLLLLVLSSFVLSWEDEVPCSSSLTDAEEDSCNRPSDLDLWYDGGGCRRCE